MKKSLHNNKIYKKRLSHHEYFREKHYIHEFVNHSTSFVDPIDKTINTNKIEWRWSLLRKYIKRNTGEGYINFYLNNFLFFYHFNPDDRYTLIIKLISKNPDYFKMI
jgi:hypothetical protein